MQGSLLQTIAAVKAEQPQIIRYALSMRIKESAGRPLDISPEFAANVLEHLNFEGQRKRRDGNITKHKYRILRGRWIESFPVTFCRLPNGQLVLVDGQHRLRAIADSGITVGVTFAIVAAENMNEVRHIYAGFDEVDSARSVGEVCEAAEVGVRLGFAKNYLNKVFIALPILGNEMEPPAGSSKAPGNQQLWDVDNRIEEAVRWAEEAHKMWKVIDSAKGKLRTKLQGSGVLALGMYTFRHQATKADEFWTKVADDSGLDAGDPRKTLNTYLKESNAKVGSVRTMVLAPATAWNAYYQHRPLTLIRCFANSPIKILGTPLARR